MSQELAHPQLQTNSRPIKLVLMKLLDFCPPPPQRMKRCHQPHLLTCVAKLPVKSTGAQRRQHPVGLTACCDLTVASTLAVTSLQSPSDPHGSANKG